VKRARLGLFLALCAVQLAIPLAMAYRYERTLREGTVYRFHTEPFDPVDAFRGRYVAIRLRLDWNQPSTFSLDRDVYAVLQRDVAGFASVHHVQRTAPESGDWLRGEAFAGFARIELPFDRYYMEEGKAPAADRIWREGMQQAEAVARVRVRHGLGAIEGLDINGVPIEKWVETLPPGK